MALFFIRKTINKRNVYQLTMWEYVEEHWELLLNRIMEDLSDPREKFREGMKEAWGGFLVMTLANVFFLTLNALPKEFQIGTTGILILICATPFIATLALAQGLRKGGTFYFIGFVLLYSLFIYGHVANFYEPVGEMLGAFVMLAIWEKL